MTPLSSPPDLNAKGAARLERLQELERQVKRGIRLGIFLPTCKREWECYEAIQELVGVKDEQ